MNKETTNIKSFSLKNILIVIPAIKKQVVFTNDLVKQLAGVSLVQRVINKAKELTLSKEHIYVITDSEEISLIANRNGINFLYDQHLGEQAVDLTKIIKEILLNNSFDIEDILILSAYAPLITVQEIYQAYSFFKSNTFAVIVPVMKDVLSIHHLERNALKDILYTRNNSEMLIESKAFRICSREHILNIEQQSIQIRPFELNQKLIEISDYQDWWVCEKLLKRKRIVFRVIGGKQFGLGHIYRSLALAQMITDHEIRFVCDLETKSVADQLIGYFYWLGVFESDKIADEIIAMQPDMVINDILDTQKEYVQRLKYQGIKVVNFEDLGSGASETNLTINELYESPVIKQGHILWGHDYFFIRDEFNDAKIHHFSEKINCLLITFGGVDPSDFTRRVLRTVLPFCQEQGIKIKIVTGPGYLYIDELNKEIKAIQSVDIECTHSTGIMSAIMEKAQVAITSNGRTVYELAHMHIPSIILSHHDRENTHIFAREENGFIPLGTYQENNKEDQLLESFKRVVIDVTYRKTLFDRIKRFSFDKNKLKVEKLILDLFEH